MNEKLRKPTSENDLKLGSADAMEERNKINDLDADLIDQLGDAEQFMRKGDAFYQNKKYEQAFKVYEIARDLIKDFCQDNQEMLQGHTHQINEG